MVVPSASTCQEMKLKTHSNVARAFQWVMMATSSPSTLTIGEHNKNTNMCRASAWVIFVCFPPTFIATSAGSAYIMYKKGIWGAGFPWYLPVIMLWGVYMAVIELAMWHVTLFVPQAPYAAKEALQHVGYEKIGMAVSLISPHVLFFDQACILWSCLVGILIAAALAFWIGLVRMYGNSGSGEGGLARCLALSSIVTASLVAVLVYVLHL